MTGAVRLSMPPPPVELYVEAVTEAVRANAAWVPPRGRGALYLRPLLMGTGPILGLGPAPSYTLVVFAAAVGCYFKVAAQHVSVRASRDPVCRGSAMTRHDEHAGCAGHTLGLGPAPACMLVACAAAVSWCVRLVAQGAGAVGLGCCGAPALVCMLLLGVRSVSFPD